MIPGCVTPGQPHRSDPSGPPDPVTGRLAYSADEAARLTGLSRDLLDDHMRRGDLACITVGERRLIIRHHLQQFPGLACQNTASAMPTIDSRAGHGERPPEDGVLPDLPLDDRLIGRGLAEAGERGSPVAYVTAQRLAIWLALSSADAVV